MQQMRSRVETAERVLIALDFDGTLAPICDNPGDAAVPQNTLAALRTLVELPGVTVGILSGRSLADLKARIDIDAVYAGNHGLEIEGAGFSYVHEAASHRRKAVEQACWDLEAGLCGLRGVLVERKGLGATLHYRQAPAPLSSWIAATARLVLRPYREVLAMKPALKAWEIRPRVDWGKGAALKLLLAHLNLTDPLLVCAGDDVGDEEMFDCCPGAFSIRVGKGLPTRARYRAQDPGELLQLLEWLCSSLGQAKLRSTDRVTSTASLAYN